MQALDKWHAFVKNPSDVSSLKQLLSKEAVFYSPLLFKPQKGKSKVAVYLTAAAKMFEHSNFRYVKEIVDGQSAMLEFNAEIDGVKIDGVDIITWNNDGKILEFKVMIRPFTAIQKVGSEMKSILEKMSLWDKAKLRFT